MDISHWGALLQHTYSVESRRSRLDTYTGIKYKRQTLVLFIFLTSYSATVLPLKGKGGDPLFRVLNYNNFDTQYAVFFFYWRPGSFSCIL